ASSRAETNWEEAEESTSISPPRTEPVPCTTTGRYPGTLPSPAGPADAWFWSPDEVTETPRSARARSTGPIGRCLAAGSPSRLTGPSASAAIGGMNRITVPARPQSTVTSPVTGPGVMCRVLPWSLASIVVPSARSAPIIRSLSREERAPRIVVGSLASAASGRARLVSDFDPGIVIVASSGPLAVGAGQAGSTDSTDSTGSERFDTLSAYPSRRRRGRVAARSPAQVSAVGWPRSHGQQ